MADYMLVVGGFADAEGADWALPAVKQAAKDGLKIHDAGVVRRTAEGEVEIHDTGDWGFWKGAIVGGVVTGAAAIIAGPLGWGALAAGGLGGGVIAKVHDANIEDKALRELGSQAKQAGSALVIMVDPTDEGTVAAALASAGAVATTVGLDESTATRLAEAAGTATPPAPANAQATDAAPPPAPATEAPAPEPGSAN